MGFKVMRKIVAIVIDGVGDLSCQIFNYKSPLEISYTPFLDALARISLLLHTFLHHSFLECGVCGLMNSFEPGFACGSDTAHMMIFFPI